MARSSEGESSIRNDSSVLPLYIKSFNFFWNEKLWLYGKLNDSAETFACEDREGGEDSSLLDELTSRFTF